MCAFVVVAVLAAPAVHAVDLNELRRSLATACGENARILDVSTAEHSDGKKKTRYWMVRILPKKVGSYRVTQLRSVSIGRDTERNAVYEFSVGPRDVQRTHGISDAGDLIRPTILLRDRAILVFDVSPIYESHSFSLEREDLDLDAFTRKPRGSNGSGATVDVVNSLHEFMECLKVRRSAIPFRGAHRPPAQYVSLSFEAKKPTRFNVCVSGEINGVVGNGLLFPVQIVPKNADVDIVISNARVSGSGASQFRIGRETVLLRVGEVLITTIPFDPSQAIQSGARVIVHRVPYKLDGGVVHEYIPRGWKN
jgi:hypothetical protein